MKLSILLLVFLPFLACQSAGTKNKTYSINESKRSIIELRQEILDKGDSLAYHDLYFKFVDSDNEYNELFFYAYVMAFKYNYPKAYMDVFFILCKMYNVKVEEGPINLTSMDTVSKNLAVESVRRAALMNYLDTKEIFKSLRQ
ncbi:hypothetical protein FHW36_113113 [Chitinophaga polysaccharea]|uniref:Uncharacterized protein n=1 Tax=Chitinophaga polysaccharea TaxID=1293035 RepID=A0A561P426_9BACT|nr:hypothetical protein [Chitinophaga polysaccharea]TWF32858.1 hypothetical protein FHW36_113113 [Chitinophaga polysaccharea]